MYRLEHLLRRGSPHALAEARGALVETRRATTAEAMQARGGGLGWEARRTFSVRGTRPGPLGPTVPWRGKVPQRRGGPMIGPPTAARAVSLELSRSHFMHLF